MESTGNIPLVCTIRNTYTQLIWQLIIQRRQHMHMNTRNNHIRMHLTLKLITELTNTEIHIYSHIAISINNTTTHAGCGLDDIVVTSIVIECICVRVLQIKLRRCIKLRLKWFNVLVCIKYVHTVYIFDCLFLTYRVANTFQLAVTCLRLWTLRFK